MFRVTPVICPPLIVRVPVACVPPPPGDEIVIVSPFKYPDPPLATTICLIRPGIHDVT